MKLMNMMMGSCKEASLLSVKKSYDGLSLMESLKFKLHTKKDQLHLSEVQKETIKKAVTS